MNQLSTRTLFLIAVTSLAACNSAGESSSAGHASETSGGSPGDIACTADEECPGVSAGGGDSTSSGGQGLVASGGNPDGSGGLQVTGGTGGTCSGIECETCEGCLIAGQCFQAGVPNPDNSCQVCRPSEDPTAFSAAASDTSCDDGDACTTSDSCQSGLCEGNSVECDDGVTCNGIEACNPLTGACDVDQSTCDGNMVCDLTEDLCVLDCGAGCLVDDICYSKGQSSPNNPCFVCDPDHSISTLTPNVGAACGTTPTVCLPAGVCDEVGTCSQIPTESGVPCGMGIGECASSTCDGTGLCQTSYESTQTPCSGTPPSCHDSNLCDGAGSCVTGAPLPLTSECGEHAECTGNETAPSCTCVFGYELSGGTCVDTDECARQASDCDSFPDACVNEEGAYRCDCPPSFSGNGVGEAGCSCARDDYSPLCEPWSFVAAYDDSACAISAGALYCWGANSAGELGTGDTSSRTRPARVGTENDWESVTVGDDHACGIRSGVLYCWGDSALGALGRPGPEREVLQVGTATDWIQVEGGLSSTCGIRDGGDLYCWGYNGSGQVGQNTTDIQYTSPQLVVPAGGFTDVSIQGFSVCAIRAGELYCWGEANYVGWTAPDQLSPDLVEGYSDWTSVALSVGEGCATRASGELYCWDKWEELGPVLQPEFDDWESVAADFSHRCGLRDGGRAFCSGTNTYGELGDGTTVASSGSFSEVASTGVMTQVAVGEQVSFGIVGGGLYGWGMNSYGRRGTGPAFAQVGSANDWTQVATHNHWTCGLREPGELYCWGVDRPLDSTQPNLPVSRIGTDSDWESISLGFGHLCGVRSGALYCFGDNEYGQLGDGSQVGREEPTQIGTATDWLQTAAGWAHTCAVNDGGDLYCWGNNDNGQLGDGTFDPQLAPQLVDTLSWTAIASGVDNSCGVKASGLYCWGSEGQGVLGNQQSNGQQSTPIRIGTSTGWISSSIGFVSACGLLGDAPYCWGSGLYSTLGNGSSSSTIRAPLAASVDSGFSDVSSGIDSVCGVTVDGLLYCWGRNVHGQLATGDFTTRTTPELVTDSSGWEDVTVGNARACGIRSGELYCWGSNAGGGLGHDEDLIPIPLTPVWSD